MKGAELPTLDEVNRRYLLMVSVLGHRDVTAENWAVLQRIAGGARIEELIQESD